MMRPIIPSLISIRRIIAYAVDVGLLSCALWVPQLAIQFLKGVTPASVFNMSTGLNAYVWVVLTISLPSWLYFVISDRSDRGTTLGKRLFGLHVVNKTGGRLGLGQAMLRTLIKVVPWELTHVIFFLPFLTSGQNAGFGPELITPYVLLAIYVAVMLRTRGKQSLHDLVAGTVVIRS